MLYICFGDLQKVFDKIKRNYVWETWGREIEENMTQTLYKNKIIKIKTLNDEYTYI